MNKSELVASVQEHLGAETSKATAERAVEAVLEGLKKGIRRTKMFSLSASEHFQLLSALHARGLTHKLVRRFKSRLRNPLNLKQVLG